MESAVRERKEQIKALLKRLHEGEDMSSLRERFKEILRSVSPMEIPLIEQELVAEGVPVQEIARLCDVHVELFREAVSGALTPDQVEPGHPLHTRLRENEQIVRDAEVLGLYARSMGMVEGEARESSLEVLRGLAAELRGVSRHYAKDETVVFPYIERRGLTAVPRVLWTKHDQIRNMVRGLNRLVRQDPSDWASFSSLVSRRAEELSRALVDMVFRENNILYPTLRVLLSEGEWAAIREMDDEIGYYKVEPEVGWTPRAEPLLPHQVSPEITEEQARSLPQEMRALLSSEGARPVDFSLKRDGDLEFETGYLSPEEVEAIFSALPVDVSFVDASDRVRFYSHGGRRIFPRARAVLGRPVKLCHPPKSVHIVERILEEFKAGRRDVAEFWIRMGDRLVHIRYFPVRGRDGRYLGTLEVVQDVTDIKRLEGERRILDWK